MIQIKSIFICLLFFACNGYAEIRVIDDSNNEVILDKPATRIISLAPHITELLFSAGAENQIVGTVSYSDYPEKAKNIPLIGSYEKVDYEKILALQPDIILYWKSGNPIEMIDGLKKLNFTLFNNEPNKFVDVAESIRALGQLLGSEKAAEKQAKDYLKRLEKLKQKYAVIRDNKVRVFYQVWNSPLMTINREHLVNDVIDFCGGVNIFSELDNIAPTVDIESIMKKNPHVIIAGMTKGRETWLDEWQRWQAINAVKQKNVYAINAELIVRQTPRILDGTEDMCEILDKVRNKKI